jgi:hypothetical protein
MLLISYSLGGKAHIGVMRDNRQFVPVSEQHADIPGSLKALLAMGEPGLAMIRRPPNAGAARADANRSV